MNIKLYLYDVVNLYSIEDIDDTINDKKYEVDTNKLITNEMEDV